MVKPKRTEGWKLVGTVGVDSGQVMICDPCYLPERRLALEKEYGKRDSEWFDGADETTDEIHDARFSGEFSYRGVCSTTMHFGVGQLYYRKGHPGAGVASSTTCGDGRYPVYARRDTKGRVHALLIVFDEDTNGKPKEIPQSRSEMVKRAKAVDRETRHAQVQRKHA